MTFMITRRAELVADAAIEILAERGMRGLTHRAVDEAAGLPQGSTSNHARTRSALLELALARLAEREEAMFSGFRASGSADGPPAPDDLAGLLARATHHALSADRRATIARYELALEATRRQELRAVYDEIGRRFREPAVALMAAVGSPDPVRHGHRLVAFAEGLLFYAVVGAGETPSLDELHAAFADFVAGCLR
jgi:DNA-binding transcriptional regulator YbjK